MITSNLKHVRALFLLAVVFILAALYTVGVGMREQEIAFLTSVGRALSTAGYRAQYALGANGGMAAVGSAGSIPPAVHAEGTAHSVPVLLYHGIVSSSDRFSLTQEQFKDQMFALKRAGYQTVSIADFIAFEKGEKELPAKSFLLTFDDGRADSYERGDPVLEAVGYSAVMYVATEDSLDDPKEHSGYYLTADELERMQATRRWEIGSHARQVGGGFVPLDASGTKGNFLSNYAWRGEEGRQESDAEYAARLDDELGTSQKLLAERFGPIDSFSYPFGDYGQQWQNQPDAERLVNGAVRRYYAIAFEQVWPGDARYSANYPEEDPYHLRRIEVDTHWSGAMLVAFLNATARALPYTEVFDSDIGWKHNWGILTMRDTSLVLDATPSSTGALTFLDGTGDWQNYRYAVHAQIKKGTTLGLIARYSDERSMLSCTFSDGVVRLKQKVDGKESVIAERLYTVPQEAVLNMGVAGTGASCSVNETRVVHGSFDPRLERGGVGLTIWDETIGSASATLTSIEVTEI